MACSRIGPIVPRENCGVTQGPGPGVLAGIGDENGAEGPGRADRRPRRRRGVRDRDLRSGRRDLRDRPLRAARRPAAGYARALGRKRAPGVRPDLPVIGAARRFLVVDRHDGGPCVGQGERLQGQRARPHLCRGAGGVRGRSLTRARRRKTGRPRSLGSGGVPFGARAESQRGNPSAPRKRSPLGVPIPVMSSYPDRVRIVVPPRVSKVRSDVVVPPDASTPLTKSTRTAALLLTCLTSFTAFVRYRSYRAKLAKPWGR